MHCITVILISISTLPLAFLVSEGCSTFKNSFSLGFCNFYSSPCSKTRGSFSESHSGSRDFTPHCIIWCFIQTAPFWSELLIHSNCCQRKHLRSSCYFFMVSLPFCFTSTSLSLKTRALFRPPSSRAYCLKPS